MHFTRIVHPPALQHRSNYRLVAGRIHSGPGMGRFGGKTYSLESTYVAESGKGLEPICVRVRPNLHTTLLPHPQPPRMLRHG